MLTKLSFHLGQVDFKNLVHWEHHTWTISAIHSAVVCGVHVVTNVSHCVRISNSALLRVSRILQWYEASLVMKDFLKWRLLRWRRPQYAYPPIFQRSFSQIRIDYQPVVKWRSIYLNSQSRLLLLDYGRCWWQLKAYFNKKSHYRTSRDIGDRIFF